MNDIRYNLIYFLKQKEIGTGITSIYLKQTFSDLFNCVNCYTEELPVANRIWRLQNPFLYKNIPLQSRLNDIWCLRSKYCNFFPGKRITNGYSYYKQYQQLYTSYFPTIYQSSFKKATELSIGYYAREMRNESNLAFVEFIKHIPADIPIITMGTKELIENHIPTNRLWKHTYDAAEFWKSCSTYFYYRCSDFEDPLPHTLLEAIQSKHVIISPKSKYRIHEDGIDDLLSCTDFTDKFTDITENKNTQLLAAKNFKRYLTTLVESAFTIKPKRFNTFKEFVEYII